MSHNLHTFRAGLVSRPRAWSEEDTMNRILRGAELEERKLKNLLGLEVYRQRTVSAEISPGNLTARKSTPAFSRCAPWLHVSESTN